MLGERSSAIVYPCLALGRGNRRGKGGSGVEGTRALIARYSATYISTQPRSEFRSQIFLSQGCFGDEALEVISPYRLSHEGRLGVRSQ